MTYSAAEVLAAVEDYDLAYSRFAWVSAARCVLGEEQLAAIAWHAQQREDTQALMHDVLDESPDDPAGPDA